MKVELISIGDELLIGQTINTNASWLGQELALRGAKVTHCAVIMDTEVAIVEALDIALSRADVVIITGGLGPTKDDITKITLTKYFGTELEIDADVLKHVTSFFQSRGREMLEVNIQQAALPKSALVLNNALGTAPGMLFDIDGKTVMSVPGVPYEMKHVMSTSGFDYITDKYPTTDLFHRTIHLQGIGESFIADRISDIESGLLSNNIKLAYLPSPGIVRLRFTCQPNNQEEKLIDEAIEEVKKRLPKYYFSENEGDLSQVVGTILKRKSSFLGTVESCSGGQIANEIVRVSGSSDYFKGSLVSYSNELKVNLVKVTPSAINDFGAVSEEVVSQMAVNGRTILNVDYCISTSGVAGPTGGSPEKPVGTIWICVAGPNEVITKKCTFGEDRARNIKMTALTGLNMLRRMLLEINN